MAYSRWSNSRWYTYWIATPSFQYLPVTSYERDNQIFCIEGIKNFTYKQLINYMNGCLEAVRKECKGEVRVTDKEIEELRGYMYEFIKNVSSNQEINEYMEVKEARPDELPLLVNVMTRPAKELLEKRLKEL